jgi:GLPGLI family protein
MKNYLFFIVLLSYSVFGQTNIRVNYSFYESYRGKAPLLPAFLQITDTFSYFEIEDHQLEEIPQTITTEDVSYNTINMTVKSRNKVKENRFVRKDFTTNSVLSLVNYNGWSYELLFINEELPNLEWVLADDENEILGYLCKNATTTFRGREYEAWYTTAIPIPDGPWKFSGLPGLILQITDSKENINIEAYSIEMNKETNLNFSVSDAEEKKAKVFNNWEAYYSYVEENIIQGRKYFKSMVSQANGASVEFEYKYETIEFVFKGVDNYTDSE